MLAVIAWKHSRSHQFFAELSSTPNTGRILTFMDSDSTRIYSHGSTSRLTTATSPNFRLLLIPEHSVGCRETFTLGTRYSVLSVESYTANQCNPARNPIPRIISCRPTLAIFWAATTPVTANSEVRGKLLLGFRAIVSHDGRGAIGLKIC